MHLKAGTHPHKNWHRSFNHDNTLLPSAKRVRLDPLYGKASIPAIQCDPKGKATR